MAQRRMTSLEVIDTDAFLDMPVSSQLLYFHLNARADDDGFVSNPKKTVRMINAGTDDLKMLFAKKFLIAFEDGVCVIKHWRINNFIRKDIYKETKYLDWKQTLFIRSNGAYTLKNDERAIPVPTGHFRIEDVNVALTERQLRLGKDRLGKDRLDKDRLDNLIKKEIPSPKEKARDFFSKGEVYKNARQKLLEIASEQAVDSELSKFSDYWTEKNSTGTKERWQMQKTFEVEKRLGTWLRNASKFTGTKSRGKQIV